MPIPIIKIKHGIEKLVSQSGLFLVGILLELTKLKDRLKEIPGVHCIDPVFSHADVLFSMIGLICIGKPDFDAIENYRSKPEFLIDSLGISNVPSAPTLRQRADLIGTAANNTLKEECISMIGAKASAVTAIETSVGPMIPIDFDVSPFDNSKTHKEGVSRTYKGVDGYSPIFAYLGTEGYLINLELREGCQHCQKNTPQFIMETLDYARKITPAPILMRLDSGNDAQENFPDKVRYPGVEFIIKRNLRKESPCAWMELAQKEGQLTVTCERKKVWRGKTLTGLKGQKLPYPIFFDVTERYRDKKGQKFIIPELEVDTYWCSLEQMPVAEVIELYHDHGTSEQFHSELKSDMGIERLPSGNFATNSLILHLAMISYNILRIIGQQWVAEDETEKEQLPKHRQKKVTRRRARTVIQDLIYMAGRLIRTGGQLCISFGQLNPFASLWERIALRLRGSPVSV